MENSLKYFKLPTKFGRVDVVHILNDGKVVFPEKDLEPFEQKFKWVNRAVVSDLILELKVQTDAGRKSIIAIYENGKLKIHTNISRNFTKYGSLNDFVL